MKLIPGHLGAFIPLSPHLSLFFLPFPPTCPPTHLRICFFHQKEVTWVLCLELITSTSRTGCHAQVLFCSRPHDLLQSLLLDYTTSRLCSSEGPLIPDLMIPPDVDLCLKCPLIPDLILQIPLVLNLTISNSLSSQILWLQISPGLELSLQKPSDSRPCLINFSGLRPYISQLPVLDLATPKPLWF